MFFRKPQADSVSDLIVVRTYPNVIEAEVAKSALESARIDSLIQSNDAGGMRPAMTVQVRLLVRADDADRATDILDASTE